MNKDRVLKVTFAVHVRRFTVQVTDVLTIESMPLPVVRARVAVSRNLTQVEKDAILHRLDIIGRQDNDNAFMSVLAVEVASFQAKGLNPEGQNPHPKKWGSDWP